MMVTPALTSRALRHAYDSTNHRLFMFDFDGTLTPIVNNPNDAIPSDKSINYLQQLSSSASNRVWIISGRDQEFLDYHFGHIQNLGLSAEHGCFARQPQQTIWTNHADKLDMAWQSKVKNTFGELVHKVPGSHIEEKKVAITWHYRNAMDYTLGEETAHIFRTQLENELAEDEVEVMMGKANLEVRPRLITKGYLAQRLLAADPIDFVLCCGDDTTDEGNVDEHTRKALGLTKV